MYHVVISDREAKMHHIWCFWSGECVWDQLSICCRLKHCTTLENSHPQARVNEMPKVQFICSTPCIIAFYSPMPTVLLWIMKIMLNSTAGFYFRCILLLGWTGSCLIIVCSEVFAKWLNCLLALCPGGDYKAIELYFRELSGASDQTVKKLDCCHCTLDKVSRTTKDEMENFWQSQGHFRLKSQQL